MKAINIRFLDFWGHFDREGFVLTIAFREVCKALSILVDIVDENKEYQYVDSETKDVVIYSVFGEKHWFVPDSAIKIFYTGENICPDFNACDYALGFEWMEYGDRYFRLPNYLATPFFINHTRQMEALDRGSFSIDMAHRDFCSFVVSNADANPVRQQFFDALSKYKKVDSGGRYLNNVGGPVDDKLDFCKRHKFTIAFENSSHPGYTTEKIVDAYASCSVPIYWGDPYVAKVFNPHSFINVGAFDDIESAIRRIIEIDNDDERYMAMLKACPYLSVEKGSCQRQYEMLSAWVRNIICVLNDNCAHRYNRDFWGKKYVERHVMKEQKSLSLWTKLKQKI